MSIQSTKPIDHGFITPKAPEVKQEPAIPRVLRVGILEWWSDTDKNIQRYGLWTVEAKEEFFHCGKIIRKGDRLKLAGNDAVVSALSGRIAFCDARLDEEQALFEKAKKLGVGLTANPGRVQDHRENFVN